MKIPASFKRAFCSKTTALALAIACVTGSVALPINAAYAAETTNRKVRVGLFTMPGYQEKDSSGNYKGYGYDFLQSLKLYNNWDYEYVEYGGSYAAALKGLEKGEVDIVTSTTKNVERLLKYSFSSKPIGTSSTILTIKQGPTSFEAGNYATYNGMKVGMLVGNSRNNSFAAFAKENGFTYEPVYFKSVEAITKALHKGLIDAQISSDLRRHDGEDILDIFDYKDFYLITRIEDKKLMEEANSAINKLYHVNPNWIEKLTEKYYEVPPDGSVNLTKQEKDYIAAHNKAGQKLRVLFYPDHKPFAYYKDGRFQGETVALFTSLAKKVGLEYEIIPAYNIEQFNKAIKNKEADIIAGMVSSNTAAEKLGYILTEAHQAVNQAVLKNVNSKQVRSIAVNKNAAPQVQYAKERYSQGISIIEYNTNEECVNAVKDGKADICLTNILEANVALMKDYRHTFEVQTLYTKINIAMGISSYRDRVLASILSKGINSFTKEELDQFMLQSMTELKKEQTLESMIYENPLMLAGFVALGLGIVGTLILARRRRQHLRIVEEKNQALQQAYEESEAQVEEIRALNTQLQDNQTRLEELTSEQESQIEEITSLNNTLEENQAKLEEAAAENKAQLEEITAAKDELEASQEALAAAKLAAEAANEAKTTFLNNMSHDIRTPMNAILGFTRLIERDINKPESVAVSVHKIKNSGHYLLNIINNVLDMARIESGKVSLNLDFIDLQDPEANILNVFEEEFKKKDLKASFALEVEHRYILIDIAKSNEIVVNLISNAIKYTPNGGSISINMKELPCSKPGYGTYCWSITDTGIGMSKEYQKTLFEAFTREKNTTQSKVVGTGLGMAIVKKLIDFLGGTIEVESEQGKGTTFRVYLDNKLVDRPQDYLKKQVESIPDNIDFTGKRIILAEDNELNAEIAMALLEDEGFVVEHAEDGVSCVEMLNKAEASYYDVILMDIQMPYLDGYGATAKIRQLEDKAKANIPILAMTANAFEEDKRKALEAGMDGFCTKPIDVEQLNRELAKVLKK